MEILVNTNAFKDESNILGVWLFGSCARGETKESSDIDIAILYDRPLRLMEQIEVENRIEDTLGINGIDFVNLNKVGLPFQHRVLCEGKLIYNKDRNKVAEFIERVIIEYCDFEPTYEIYLAAYFEGIDERYGY